MDAIRLRPSDQKAAAAVFARAFFDYPIMVSHWPDPARRARYLPWYLGCAVNYALRYGEAYTTRDLAGLALWLPPHATHFTVWRYVRSGFLATPLIMGFRRSFEIAVQQDDAAQKAHEQIMPGPHWYLWMLGVDPGQQGIGTGCLLMQPGLDAADRQQLPCYLETHDEKNVPFYIKRGFELVHTQQIPGSDLRFWSFVRHPRKDLVAKKQM